MRVALAQLNYTIGDFEGNKIKIIRAIERAKSERASLVVFSEHAVSGAPAYDLLNKASFLDEAEEALVEVAAVCDNITVLIGLPVQHKTKAYSAVAMIHDRHLLHYFTKKNIIARDELGFINSGTGCQHLMLEGKKIALSIDRDIMLEESIGFVDLVINVASYPYSRGIIEARNRMFAKKAFEYNSNVLFLNQVGGNTDIVFDGSSVVFDRTGKCILQLKEFEEDFAVIDIDGNNESIDLDALHNTDHRYNAMKRGLKDFFSKNDFTKACIGLSGGLDSAVVAAVAVDALGADNVKALLMPSQFSTDHSLSDALDLAGRLGIEHHTVPINNLYDMTLDAMSGVFGEDNEFGITEENIQARLRCVLLMAYSNKYGYQLLNTSNKSELALGFGTLYGDNTGVISIIGDLYKGEVYNIARYINREEELIPVHILEKDPSGELRPGQKDTDEFPPYDIVDAILYRMLEENQSREEIINAGYDRDVVYKVYDRILRNEQKRRQFCPTLRLSIRPFNTRRKMPITGKYGF